MIEDNINDETSSTDTNVWDPEVNLADFEVLAITEEDKPAILENEESNEKLDVQYPSNHSYIKELATHFDKSEDRVGVKPPTEDCVKEFNLGTDKNPRPVLLNENMNEKEISVYIDLLREFIDVFIWNYAEMRGLDIDVIFHKLNIRDDVKPIKQIQRQFHPEVMDKIEAEVQKLKDVGFI